MKRNNRTLFIVVGTVAALLSLIISNHIFGSPAHHHLKAPTVETVSTAFPDIKNDSNYNAFLNSKALDPTQPVQIGNTQNTAPFH